MYNTAKVEYLLCGSLEDEEKKLKQSRWLQICVGGARADGMYPVSVVVIMCL